MKLVKGVGINDANYVTSKAVYTTVDGKRKKVVVWYCPYMLRWRNMLDRCYSPQREKLATYNEALVCNEWLTFSNFKEWMSAQDWEGKELDKDLLVKGNKIYSPETCVFVPSYINNLLTGRYSDKLPGVLKNSGSKKNPYRVTCRDGNGGLLQLGLYKTELEAHKAWQSAKIDVVRFQMERLKSDMKEPYLSKILGVLDNIILKISQDIKENKPTQFI